ncbi:hypothetical protein LP7551_01468 [Roseibium album]|nr:hypothetical protein LP7551_01468 [Roseibium album]
MFEYWDLTEAQMLAANELAIAVSEQLSETPKPVVRACIMLLLVGEGIEAPDAAGKLVQSIAGEACKFLHKSHGDTIPDTPEG